MDERSRIEIEAEEKILAEERSEKINQRVTDFKHSFETPHGKRVLAFLSRELYEKRMSFVKGDSHGTSFNEGKRFAILEIRHWLDYDLTKLNQE